jgi:hypothetical protein
VLSTQRLRQLCEHAEQLKFATGPSEKFWTLVKPDGRHVCFLWSEHRPKLWLWQGIDHGFNFDHNNGVNIRAMLLCEMKGTKEPGILRCDFDWHDWQAVLEENRRGEAV